MIIALTLIALSVVPDVSIDLGYGRVANRVGKPSSEMVSLRLGASIETSLRFKFGVLMTVPTTLPASLGIQVELSGNRSSMWLQGDISHTTKNFVLSSSIGWWIFGVGFQIRFNNRTDVVIFGKVSFSPTTIIRTFIAERRSQ